jgi:hypothetical protein
MATDLREDADPAGAEEPEGTRTSLQHIAEALKGLRFGTVTVVVQDGVIVQVERTEKRRLPRGCRHA